MFTVTNVSLSIETITSACRTYIWDRYQVAIGFFIFSTPGKNRVTFCWNSDILKVLKERVGFFVR